MSASIDGKQVVTVSDADLTRLVAEAIRQARPPWYERAPYSWGIGAALAVATTVLGSGITRWLGWS